MITASYTSGCLTQPGNVASLVSDEEHTMQTLVLLHPTLAMRYTVYDIKASNNGISCILCLCVP